MIPFRLLLPLVWLGWQIAWEQNKEQYHSLGVGTSSYSLQDPSVSPMTYHGSWLAVTIGWLERACCTEKGCFRIIYRSGKGIKSNLNLSTFSWTRHKPSFIDSGHS